MLIVDALHYADEQDEYIHLSMHTVEDVPPVALNPWLRRTEWTLRFNVCAAAVRRRASGGRGPAGNRRLCAGGFPQGLRENSLIGQMRFRSRPAASETLFGRSDWPTEKSETLFVSAGGSPLRIGGLRGPAHPSRSFTPSIGDIVRDCRSFPTALAPAIRCRQCQRTSFVADSAGSFRETRQRKRTPCPGCPRQGRLPPTG